MTEISNILDFYKTNLPWFDADKYNKACITSNVLNDTTYISGNRQDGSTHSLLFTVLYDLLLTDTPKHVYIKGMNDQDTNRLFKVFTEIYSEVKGNCHNFHLLNNIHSIKFGKIEFDDGSLITILKPLNLFWEIRGRHEDVWFVVDEEGMMDVDSCSGVAEGVAIASLHNNVRQLYAN